MKPCRTLAVAGLIGVMVWAGGAGRARAQEVAAQPGATVKEKPTFIAGRPELARVYVELESLVMRRAGTMPVEMLRRVNVGLDNAANAFFVGDYSSAVRQMSGLIAMVDPERGGRGAAVTARFEPMVVRITAETKIRGRVGLMYAAGKPEAFEVGIGRPRVEAGIAGRVPEMDSLARVTLGGEGTGAQAVEFAPPRWDFKVEPANHLQYFPLLAQVEGGKQGTPRERARAIGGVYLATTSLDELRESLLSRLEKAGAAHPELGAAIAACRWRVGPISDHPSRDNTYLLADPMRLEGLVGSAERLVKAIEGGTDPFNRVTGDWWVSLRIGEAELPVRMYRSEDGEAHDARPLLIAVHGAGGDENLWMDGYGAGMLKEVAREKGLMVVSPRIVGGIFTPAMFDGIVEGVARWQDVDRSRVYVMGHSLGGGVVTAWAKLRAEKIAAACSIAGVGQFTGSKKMSPMLAYGAELDGLLRPERIRASVEAAKAAGLEVEYREVANYGHVLAVGKVTREAVEWLMGHRGKGEGKEEK